MEKTTNELPSTSETEVVKGPENKGDLLDEMEDEFFAKPQNKKQKMKTIADEHKDIKKDLKTKIEDLLSYQTKKNQEIQQVLSYKDEKAIKKEKYESKKFNVKNFKEKNRAAIDEYKDLSFQKKELQKELEEEDRIYGKKIGETYQKACEDGLTDLEFRQFKRLLSVDKKEFARRFDEDTQLQNFAEITGYDRAYIDGVWGEYYGKGDRYDSYGHNFRDLINVIYKMQTGDGISFRSMLPHFNDQQKNFFVSMFNDKIKTEGVRTLENIGEIFDRYIEFIEEK